MSWNFDDRKPIYAQIITKMKSRILSGEYKLGDKVESVRELASVAGVNPNTMQKALSDMEEMGLIVTKRTAGRFITEDENIISEIKKNEINKRIREFLYDVKSLGFSVNEVVDMIVEIKKANKSVTNLEDLIKEESNE